MEEFEKARIYSVQECNLNQFLLARLEDLLFFYTELLDDYEYWEERFVERSYNKFLFRIYVRNVDKIPSKNKSFNFEEYQNLNITTLNLEPAREPIGNGKYRWMSQNATKKELFDKYCSIFQSWVDYNYNIDYLQLFHNEPLKLVYPLLNKLITVGDKKAKEFLDSEKIRLLLMKLRIDSF